jgi:hypothetical protein
VIFGWHRPGDMIDQPSSTTGRDYPRLQMIITSIAK